MIVCKQCLVAIESHEGKQICGPLVNPIIKFGYFDKNDIFVEDEENCDGEEYIKCEWCDEMFTSEHLTEI